MASPFIGEIRMFGFNFAPTNWAMCNGQLLAISQYSALFSLLGTTYGGNGQTTFGLPDLRGRVPIHQGTGQGLSTYVIGQIAGTENVTLLSTQMPQHNHGISAVSNTGGNQPTPSNNFLAAESTGTSLDYSSGPLSDSTMNPAMVQPAGNSLPHTNIQPYLAITFCIALNGVFPSRN